jgi:uncharacterized membrane protein YfbV (UPF0208 family)
MNSWPLRKELYAMFPEGRVIHVTRFSMKVMPPLGVGCAAVMLQVMGVQYLPQVMAIVAFFLSIPFQGLLWLGVRSNTFLPPTLMHMYYEIVEKMQQQGCAFEKSAGRPRYYELAVLLKKAFSELDRTFTDRWF